MVASARDASAHDCRVVCLRMGVAAATRLLVPLSWGAYINTCTCSCHISRTQRIAQITTICPARAQGSLVINGLTLGINWVWSDLGLCLGCTRRVWLQHQVFPVSGTSNSYYWFMISWGFHTTTRWWRKRLLLS
jgi:hypothetical protein